MIPADYFGFLYFSGRLIRKISPSLELWNTTNINSTNDFPRKYASAKL